MGGTNFILRRSGTAAWSARRALPGAARTDASGEVAVAHMRGGPCCSMAAQHATGSDQTPGTFLAADGEHDISGETQPPYLPTSWRETTNAPDRAVAAAS
eukprot:4304233-Pleurochrysis_carterae.AAC.1